jgi:hypothetical protein
MDPFTPFTEREYAPVANVHADLVALNHKLLAVRQRQIADEVEICNLQTRVNRLNGVLSDLTQRFELNAARKKPGPTDPTPMRADETIPALEREDRLTG